MHSGRSGRRRRFPVWKIRMGGPDVYIGPDHTRQFNEGAWTSSAGVGFPIGPWTGPCRFLPLHPSRNACRLPGHRSATAPLTSPDQQLMEAFRQTRWLPNAARCASGVGVLPRRPPKRAVLLRCPHGLNAEDWFRRLPDLTCALGQQCCAFTNTPRLEWCRPQPAPMTGSTSGRRINKLNEAPVAPGRRWRHNQRALRRGRRARALQSAVMTPGFRT